ncbi:MAG: AcrR family transcriptional regulator [Dinoroseobacter sp.]|jgi:AcrR family transcriptional regulator
MSINIARDLNLNEASSNATRARLVESTIDLLIKVGFTKTTGVAVCRRAGLTRGALNHHFPVFSELFVETLQTIYWRLLDVHFDKDASLGVLEGIVIEGHARIILPEFKAVIELWLASKNDSDLGKRLAQAIGQSAQLFTPEIVLDRNNKKISSENREGFEAIYRTIFEALIGIGLGRAVGGGTPMDHESMVLRVLRDMARQYDRKHEH